jgi:hypothetical protein
MIIDVGDDHPAGTTARLISWYNASRLSGAAWPAGWLAVAGRRNS